MEVDDIVNAELIQEFSYEDDYDHVSYVEHNHFTKCPVCGKEYASTDAYIELDASDTEIECNECNTAFFRVSDYWYHDLQLKITRMVYTVNPFEGLINAT